MMIGFQRERDREKKREHSIDYTPYPILFSQLAVAVDTGSTFALKDCLQKNPLKDEIWALT